MDGSSLRGQYTDWLPYSALWDNAFHDEGYCSKGDNHDGHLSFCLAIRDNPISLPGTVYSVPQTGYLATLSFFQIEKV